VPHLLLVGEQLVLRVFEVEQLVAQVGHALLQIAELRGQLARDRVVLVDEVGLQHAERALEQIAAIGGEHELAGLAVARGRDLQRLERHGLALGQPQPADVELLAIEQHAHRAEQLLAALRRRVAHRLDDRGRQRAAVAAILDVLALPRLGLGGIEAVDQLVLELHALVFDLLPPLAPPVAADQDAQLGVPAVRERLVGVQVVQAVVTALVAVGFALEHVVLAEVLELQRKLLVDLLRLRFGQRVIGHRQ
jgi:hypothetical protein